MERGKPDFQNPPMLQERLVATSPNAARQPNLSDEDFEDDIPFLNLECMSIEMNNGNSAGFDTAAFSSFPR